MSNPISINCGISISGDPEHKAVTLSFSSGASLDLPGLALAVEPARGSVILGLGNGDAALNAVSVTPRWPEFEATSAVGVVTLPGCDGAGAFSHSSDAHDDTWSGAVSLRLGPISVNGFGTVTLGDNASLLVLLSAEFFPPIQLSFGFTLAGVGGIVGVNRRPDVQALVRAVSSGDLSWFMFPSSPGTDLDRILPVLEDCFPPTRGDVVVGPMVKIGWGTPTLISATVGVLTSDCGVVVVGRAAITLPAEQAPLIHLEALLVGAIDSNGLTVAASLANSYFVGIPVQGDFRLRLRTGSDAFFAVSAGGFHPAFVPPDGMAGMKRIGFEISPGPLVRARLGAYLAVTTTSVQFGAAAELAVGIHGVADLTGHFSFDAFVVFDPTFGFTADFTADVAVVVEGYHIGSVDFSGHLSGPAPYCIRGHASVSLLFFDVDINLPEITWGPNPLPPQPARDPFAVALSEIGTSSNWSGSTGQIPLPVRLAPGVDGGTVVHPMSELAFRQSAVPIGIDLQRMDGVALAAPVTIEFSGEHPPIQAQFAPSLFFDCDKTDKLGPSGFETYDAGFRVDGGTAFHAQQTVTRTFRPEITVFPERARQQSPQQSTNLRSSTCDIVARSTARLIPLRLHDPARPVVASTSDLSAASTRFSDELKSAARAASDTALLAAADHSSRSLLSDGAFRTLGRMTKQNPAAAHGLQVIAAWETAHVG